MCAVALIIAVAIILSIPGIGKISSKPAANGLNVVHNIFSQIFSKHIQNYESLSVHKLESQDKDFQIDANGVLVKYTGMGGKVVIPDGVKTIGYFAFEYNNAIEEVIMPDSVQSIQEETFFDCPNLTEVVFSKNLKSIGEKAFCICNLKILICRKMSNI